VKKLAIALLLVIGCTRPATVGSPANPNTPGAATAREALIRFMSAAKAQDLDAMSIIWGTAQGPVRSTMDRPTWEQREVIMMRCLRHDSYRVLGEAPAAGGERVLAAELKFGDLTRSANFTAIPGPSSRWYLQQVEIDKLGDICQRK
jgi:hypothetical protein